MTSEKGKELRRIGTVWNQKKRGARTKRKARATYLHQFLSPPEGKKKERRLPKLSHILPEKRGKG